MMSEAMVDQLDTCRSFFEEEHLQEYLNRVADILGISSAKFYMNLGSKKGDNHMGIIYRVFIEGERNGTSVRIPTIFKVPHKDELRRIRTDVTNFFPREQIFYTEIVPVFKDFLKARNKILENIAECYFSSTVDHKEAICLEDLQPKGFMMCDHLKQMDFAHISLAFRALGRLHALSFALRDQRPEIFASKIVTLKDPLFRPDFITDPFQIDCFEKYGEIVKMALADEDSKYIDKFSEFAVDALSHMKWSCDGSNAEPYAVLVHGDFWMNNMLFKYTKDTTEPQDIYFLDFQLSCYAPAAADIFFILYCSCNQKLRDNHFDKLVKIYHESLSDYLSELGSDAKTLFPFEALLAQLKKFGINIAGRVMMSLHYLIRESKDLKDVDVDNLGIPLNREDRIQKDEFFKKTLTDIFKDLIDRYYF